jgi:hypothetical protein
MTLMSAAIPYVAPFVDPVVGSAIGACEKCFGAFVDSPVVAAVSASMFLLLVVTSCVLGGITAFFRRAHERSVADAPDPGSGRPDPGPSTEPEAR